MCFRKSAHRWSVCFPRAWFQVALRVFSRLHLVFLLLIIIAVITHTHTHTHTHTQTVNQWINIPLILMWCYTAMCLCHVCPASGASSQRLCAIITITIIITFYGIVSLFSHYFSGRMGKPPFLKRKKRSPYSKMVLRRVVSVLLFWLCWGVIVSSPPPPTCTPPPPPPNCTPPPPPPAPVFFHPTGKGRSPIHAVQWSHANEGQEKGGVRYMLCNGHMPTKDRKREESDTCCAMVTCQRRTG